MFETHKSIILFTKSHVKAIRVQIGVKPKETKVVVFSWTPQTLPKVLLAVKKITGENVRILLNDDLVYVVTLALSEQDTRNREQVKIQAQTLIPENLDQTSWDYKVVLVSQTQQSVVQVVAVLQSFYTQLHNALVKTKIKVEAAEPQSFAIARAFESEPAPHLLVYATTNILLACAQKGLVITTQATIAPLTTAAIQQVQQFVKDHFNLSLKKIIICGKPVSLQNDLAKQVGFPIVVYPVSAAASIAMKKDIDGQDMDVLSLSFLKRQTSSSPVKKKSNLFLVIFLSLLLFALVAAGLFLVRILF